MPSASDEALIASAVEARARAYAPYSQFAVGAALLCDDGVVATGSNVENASYGLSMCAERVALYSALASGHRSFRGIAVVGPAGATAAPCGACRQVLAEFAPELRVLYSAGERIVTTSIGELLPQAFGLALR